ncbi:MAG: hypothetical protein NC081_08935 [Roseburia sp.]|nr:hypothetical protein [Roseburia sp.]
MENNFQKPAWMEDELVQDIPQKKLDFLQQLFLEGQGKNQKELMTFLMPLLKKANQEGLKLTQQEMNAAISSIKKHSTDQEKEKINQLLKKTNMKIN